jgi:protein gp37
VTGIEWTDKVWNPTTGCDRVSPGCDHCYAMTMAKRLKGMGQAKYQTDGDPRTSGPGFGVAMHADALTLPLSWRKPQKVFVNSMSDLFHEKVTDEFIAQVFAVMALAPRHTFQVLTKRHARMRSLLGTDTFRHSVLVEAHRAKWGADADLTRWEWPLRNVWLGVSAEDQKWADIRIPALLDTPAAVRWISAEPLLGPIDLTRMGPRQFASVLHPSTDQDTNIVRRGLDWVVVGGESGRGARPMHPSWARSLRDQCAVGGVPFLYKQHGEWVSFAHPGNPDGTGRDPWAERDPDAYVNERDGQVADEAAAVAAGGSWMGVYRVGKGKAGRVLDGRTWDEYPAVAS